MKREHPIISPQAAYPRLSRVKHCIRHIRAMAGKGKLEITQSRFVANTYGIEQSLVKRIKARFRNELCFREMDK